MVCYSKSNHHDRSKELRTCCSTLRIKGVKNAQKYTMVERITEQKHQTMGIVAEIKPPHSIAVEAQARKRARLDKISEIAEAVAVQVQQQKQQEGPQGQLGQQHGQRGVGNEWSVCPDAVECVDPHMVQFSKRRDEREHEMHQLEVEKMKIDMQNALIGSYSQLMKCIRDQTAHNSSTSAGTSAGTSTGTDSDPNLNEGPSSFRNEFQQDMSTLLDLKRSILKRLRSGSGSFQE
jgi:hypothetical protein